MSHQAHDNEALTRYLLGSLPEGEAERFDELSLTDDEFALALKAAEQDLVDAYVRGELTGATLARFESHYLASPVRRENVQFAHAFRQLVEKGASSTPVERESRAGISIFQWGLAAAALVFVLLSGWLAVENRRLRRDLSATQVERSALDQSERELTRLRSERERLEQDLKRQDTGSLAVAAFVLTPQLRAAGGPRVLSLPRATNYVAVQLALDPTADFPAYEVALLEQSNGQILWRSGTLQATATRDERVLHVGFRTELLPSTVALLRVSGLAADKSPVVVSDYPFRVSKE